METLVDLLRETCELHGGRVALAARVGLRDERWTYDRLWQAAQAVAGYLHHDLGLRPGDRLVLWQPNAPQVVATLFGALLARVVVVPLDPASTPAFVERVVARTEAAAIVSDLAAPDDEPARLVRFAELPFDRAGPPVDDPPSAADIAEIVFTSGTTGTPKGVMLTHRNIVASIRSARTLLPANPGYRLLSLLPLSHMLEQTVGLFLPLHFGGSIFYPGSRQPAVIVRALREQRITTVVLVPRVMELLLQGIEREARDRGQWARWEHAQRVAPRLPWRLRRLLFREVHHSLGGALDFVISGGAPLDPALGAAWERMGVRAIQGYGATECAPIIATNTYWRRIPGTVGAAAPGVEVCRSPEGELLVRGANVFAGYWRDAEQTRAAFTDDGWYRTGDLAEFDAAGRITLTGRLKDLIVLPSGMKVHPEDVEQELRREAVVADCVVLGVDDAGSVRLHAVVITAAPDANAEPDDDTTLETRLREAVRAANARLAPHQHVSAVTRWRWGDFPRTNLLKVKRHEVLATLGGAPPPFHDTTADRGRLGQLARLLERVSGQQFPALSPTTDLALDLGLDSLARVELAVLLEEELGVAVDDAAIATAVTVADLLALLERSPELEPVTPIAAWPRAAPARAARALLQALLVFPAHRVVCRPFRVEELERLASLTPPVLLIANHASHLDTPSILRALPRRLRRRTAVAAAADYFYRSRALGGAMSLLLDTFPFSREQAVRASLEGCGTLVDRGWSILIYPEGTRSPDGALHPFRGGIGLLATGLRVPVVPLAVSGTHALLPKGRGWPARGPVHVRIGQPILLAPDADRAAVVERLHDAVATLLSGDTLATETQDRTPRPATLARD